MVDHPMPEAGFIAFFVFGLVLRNMDVLVDAVLDLPGDKVDFKRQVVLLFLKGRNCRCGFIKSNPYSFYSFYRESPEIFHTVSGKSGRLLSWSHYTVLLQVKGRQARERRKASVIFIP